MNQSQRFGISAVIVRMLCGSQSFRKLFHQYLVSEYFLFDLVTTEESMDDLEFYSEIFTAVSLMMSFYLEKYFGLKRVVVFAMVTLGTGIYLSKLCTDVDNFIALSALATGVANGLTLMLVIWPLWQVYFDYKGIVSALSGIAYSFGLFPALIILYQTEKDNSNSDPELLFGNYYYRGGILRDFNLNCQIYACFALILGLLAAFFLKKSLTGKTDRLVLVNLNTFKIVKNFGFLMCTLTFLCLSCYKQHFAEVYNEISLQRPIAISMIFIEAVSLALIGLCMDKVGTFYMAYAYLGIMVVHSVLYFACSGNEDLEILCYIIFTFCTVPVYMIIAMTLFKVFNTEFREAFSLSAVGFLLGLFFSEALEDSIAHGSALEFVFFTTFPLISILLIHMVSRRSKSLKYENSSSVN